MQSLAIRIFKRLDFPRHWRDCKRGARRLFRQVHNPDFFLRKSKGVIHIGAHLAEEAKLYSAKNLNVLWIEPNPELFVKIGENIANYSNQRALCRLVTDTDDKDFPFHITNNEGISSSIFELAGNTKLWPKVASERTVTLKSITLASLIEREGLDLDLYDGLVMDVQGAELLVLKGATSILSRFKFIKAEAADFELYSGCCQLSDLDVFLSRHNFRRIVTSRYRYEKSVGSCYDVVYTSSHGNGRR